MHKKSNTLVAFEAQRLLMEAALDRPGMQYRLPTESKAISFVQQCNKFRANLRKQNAEMFELVPAHIPETRYDVLIIRRKANVVIFDHNEIAGEVYDADGNRIELDDLAPATSETDMSDAVQEAAKNLKLDLNGESND